MVSKKSRILPAMAAILEETRKQYGVTQEDLAALSGIPYGTLRNIMRADVDVKVPDLVAIAAALSTKPLPGGSKEPVVITASELVDRAVVRAGGFGTFVSEVSSTLNDLERKRRQKAGAALSPAEIESGDIKRAALNDKELDADQRPTT